MDELMTTNSTLEISDSEALRMRALDALRTRKIEEEERRKNEKTLLALLRDQRREQAISFTIKQAKEILGAQIWVSHIAVAFGSSPNENFVAKTYFWIEGLPFTCDVICEGERPLGTQLFLMGAPSHPARQRIKTLADLGAAIENISGGA